MASAAASGSYWLATAPPFTSASSQPIEGRADVAVIGGGFTGLSAALTLAGRGATVRLFEAKTILSEASGRNGGHCNNGLAHDFSSIVASRGLERAKKMYRAFDAAVDQVERTVETYRIDCDFARTGKLKLAAKPGHADGLRRAQDVLAREVDRDTSFLDRTQIATEIASERFHGGILMRRSASMHVGKFGLGLAGCAVRAGAQIHENSAVIAITPSPQGFVVATPRGSIIARDVVLATGVSSSGPFGWFRKRIVPVGSFVIVTEPLGEQVVRALMPARRTCTTSLRIGNYFRFTPDHRFVFGGRARFRAPGPEGARASGAVLQAQLAEIFPSLKSARIDYCWGGLVDATMDRLPRSGVHDGMHYAMGYSGHGVQMSVLMGDIMARKIAGESVRDAWSELAWPAVPLNFARPWLLPIVGAYHRLRDRLD